MAAPNWIAILGNYVQEGRDVIFCGGTSELEGRPAPEIGNFISDQMFGGGEISCQVQFDGSAEGSAAGLILYYHPETGGFVSATLGVAGSLCSIGTWGGQQWTHHAAKGPATQLRPDVPYRLMVRAIGSRVTLSLNDVRVLSTNLPFTLPRGQAGLWALGQNDIRFSSFSIKSERPSIFVVMQFTTPFDELYQDVIVPVCEGQGFTAVRADQTYGPGVIISDIARQISESSVVVADITPDNPNVFWEVGYAHALQKPTVLIAERGRQLPFDVSPFRTLFYDNTIAGKRHIEEGLSNHLSAIQNLWSAV
jgi:hypothetical protein